MHELLCKESDACILNNLLVLLLSTVRCWNLKVPSEGSPLFGPDIGYRSGSEASDSSSLLGSKGLRFNESELDDDVKGGISGSVSLPPISLVVDDQG